MEAGGSNVEATAAVAVAGMVLLTSEHVPGCVFHQLHVAEYDYVVPVDLSVMKQPPFDGCYLGLADLRTTSDTYVPVGRGKRYSNLVYSKLKFFAWVGDVVQRVSNRSMEDTEALQRNHLLGTGRSVVAAYTYRTYDNGPNRVLLEFDKGLSPHSSLCRSRPVYGFVRSDLVVERSIPITFVSDSYTIRRGKRNVPVFITLDGKVICCTGRRMDLPGFHVTNHAHIAGMELPSLQDAFVVMPRFLAKNKDLLEQHKECRFNCNQFVKQKYPNSDFDLLRWLLQYEVSANEHMEFFHKHVFTLDRDWVDDNTGAPGLQKFLLDLGDAVGGDDDGVLQMLSVQIGVKVAAVQAAAKAVASPSDHDGTEHVHKKHKSSAVQVYMKAYDAVQLLYIIHVDPSILKTFAKLAFAYWCVLNDEPLETLSAQNIDFSSIPGCTPALITQLSDYATCCVNQFIMRGWTTPDVISFTRCVRKLGAKYFECPDPNVLDEGLDGKALFAATKIKYDWDEE